jgi:hypothetical protein
MNMLMYGKTVLVDPADLNSRGDDGAFSSGDRNTFFEWVYPSSSPEPVKSGTEIAAENAARTWAETVQWAEENDRVRYANGLGAEQAEYNIEKAAERDAKKGARKEKREEERDAKEGLTPPKPGGNLLASNSGYLGQQQNGGPNSPNGEGGNGRKPIALTTLKCSSCSETFTGQYEDGTTFNITLRSNSSGRQDISFDLSSAHNRAESSVLSRKTVISTGVGAILKGVVGAVVVPTIYAGSYYDSLYQQWKFVNGYE